MHRSITRLCWHEWHQGKWWVVQGDICQAAIGALHLYLFYRSRGRGPTGRSSDSSWAGSGQNCMSEGLGWSAGEERKGSITDRRGKERVVLQAKGIEEGEWMRLVEMSWLSQPGMLLGLSGVQFYFRKVGFKNGIFCPRLPVGFKTVVWTARSVS